MGSGFLPNPFRHRTGVSLKVKRTFNDDAPGSLAQELVILRNLPENQPPPAWLLKYLAGTMLSELGGWPPCVRAEPAPTVETPRGECAVKLLGPHDPVLVLGQPIGPIRGSEHKALKALVASYDLWRSGKSPTPALSGVGREGFEVDPSPALGGLCKRLPIFDRVLHRPGPKGRPGWQAGYWLLSAEEVVTS